MYLIIITRESFSFAYTQWLKRWHHQKASRWRKNHQSWMVTSPTLPPRKHRTFTFRVVLSTHTYKHRPRTETASSWLDLTSQQPVVQLLSVRPVGLQCARESRRIVFAPVINRLALPVRRLHFCPCFNRRCSVSHRVFYAVEKSLKKINEDERRSRFEIDHELVHQFHAKFSGGLGLYYRAGLSPSESR